MVYHRKCPNKACLEDYIGETDRKFKEKNIDHKNRDKSSNILTYSQKKGQSRVWDKDFKVLD